MPLDLELRKTYLGATDLVAVSELSPWTKPGDVWLSKMGVSTFTGNDATQMGQDLEPVVAMRHARKFGVEVVELPSEPIYHQKYHFIAANLDRIYKGKHRVLECKTAAEDQLYEKENPKWGEDGEENRVPIWYFGQVNHYIGITDFDDGVLSCLFLGKSRIQRDYPIAFDGELYNLLVENGARFWETYVRPKIQPPVTMFSPDMAMKAVALRARYEEKKGAVLESTPKVEEWARRYRDIGLEIDSLAANKKHAAAEIAQWISDLGGTKVKHSLGYFTFKRGEPKKPVDVFSAEEAWFRLLENITERNVPALLVSDLLNLAQDIQKACTTTTVPEPAEPTLRPFWAK